MKKKQFLLIAAVSIFSALIFFAAGPTSLHSSAQKADDLKMPEVITLGKDAKLGSITFNHLKHNNGTYFITAGTSIACISCHHTAQPVAEIVKTPSMKTAWPADRTTTLTSELFAKDPKAAGVAACRDCHARTGEKPKLLDAIPEIKHEGSTTPTVLNNMQAFHKTCTACHTEVKKTVATTKGPTQTQCTMCHKKTV